MDLFTEIGLLPQVFDAEHHESIQIQRWALAYIRQGLRDSWFIRSLRGGAWLEEARRHAAGSIPAREMLEFLLKHKLLVPAPSCSASAWIDEALTSHKTRPLAGVILDDLTDAKSADPPTSTVSHLPDATWWLDHPSSMDIERTPEALVRAIRLLLLIGRQLHLVDPFIAPNQYWDERTLKTIAAETLRNPSKPELTIHTSLKATPTREQATESFKSLAHLLQQHERRGRVCVWDPESVHKGFHDRYLLTDVAGCQIGAGFQRAADKTTTISVLSDADRRTYLNRFDPNPNRAIGLCLSIPIGALRN